MERALPDTVRTALKAQRRSWSGPYGFECELTGFDFAGAPQDDVRNAVAILEAANRPCRNDVAVKAVTALRLRAKTRQERAEDLDAMAALYADDLCAYPADVVVDACKAWAQEEKWFPSWSELRELAESRVEKRRKMLDALVRKPMEHANRNTPREPPRPDTHRPAREPPPRPAVKRPPPPEREPTRAEIDANIRGWRAEMSKE